MSKSVAPIGEIFAITWEEYKQRALPILAVILISTAVLCGLILAIALCAAFGGAVLTHFIDQQTAILVTIAVVSVLVCIITILAVWCYTAMLAIAVDDELGIIEAFQTGWTYLWPMTWVLTIFSGILITGLFFLIFPAILFMVWFAFCFYIMLAEDRRGLDALLASMEYVRGHWWNTFGKLLVIWLLSTMAGAIPFLGMILSIIFYPFFMLFMVNMYRDLKSVKGEAEVLAGSGTRLVWWGITAIGLIIPLIGLVVALYAFLTGDHAWMEYTLQPTHGEFL